MGWVGLLQLFISMHFSILLFSIIIIRDFWRRHRRKIFLSVGVVGGGYCLYKLYGAHRQRLDALEMELDVQRQSDELIKAQLSQ